MTGDVLLVHPDLACEATRRRLRNVFRVWSLLRQLRPRPGFIPKAEALDLLQERGWSQSSSYRLLNEGMGTFWNEERMNLRRHGGRLGLRLVGAGRLAESWGVEHLSAYNVEAPIDLAMKVGAWNAALYHVQHRQAPPPRISKKRPGFVVPSKPNRPIARQTLRKVTAVPERTQRRYEKLKLGRRKVTVRHPNFVQGQYVILEHDKYVGERKIAAGRTMPRRLGNSYTSRLRRRGYGRAKVFNRQQSHLARGAVGTFNPAKAGRRYFETVKRYVRESQRSTIAAEPFIRARGSGRAEWWSHLEPLELDEKFVFLD